jgi:DNA polymerase
MNPTAKQALELRGQLSKSSVSKLDAIVARTAEDGRLRNSYKYYGAHTGRWSGEGVQLQNLPRGTVKNVEQATSAIWNFNTYDGDKLVRCFGPPLEVVSSCLRSAFRAPEGSRFVVCDLSQIEVRVLAWLASCKLLNQQLQEDDPYILFAAQSLYSKPTSEVTKQERQIAKSAVLGAGFGIGGGEIKQDKNGDEYKSGLWGYAQNMGVEMSQEEAIKAVAVYRATYPEIPLYWKSLQNAVIDAVGNGTTREFWPLTIGAVPGKLLWIQLPSGRRLNYVRAKIDPERLDWPQVIYEGRQTQGGWGTVRTYGGKLTENVVQAIARDVLAEGMLRAHEMGFEIVGHTHDEIITLVPDSSPLNLTALTNAMISPIDWAPGLLLKAEGYEAITYKK